MINAKELRIGSLVKHPNATEKYFRVLEINMDHSGGHIVSIGVAEKIEDIVNVNDLLPIPLTPEILEKCGFQEVHGYIYLTHDALNLATLQYDKEKRIVWLEFEGTICGNEIQNLHQLQNLFFALTDEDLNIELNAPVSDTTKA